MKRAMQRAYDSHHHVLGGGVWGQSMSVREEDWRRADGSVGLHPWAIAEASEGWPDRLWAELEQNPHRGVGEIGLDRGRPHWQQQIAAFRLQMQLAARGGRHVSLHVVQCQGIMLDEMALLPLLPPKIMLHSCGCSVQMVRSYLALGKKRQTLVYFSFSSTINARSPKTPAVIAAVPDDRLLVESDEDDPERQPVALEESVRLIADARGWDMHRTIEITTQNARTFFGQI